MNICAVVVTYHPDMELVENIRLLIEQVEEIIIVDNGSADDALSMLGEMERLSKVTVVYNPENVGIAAALNIGVRMAKSRDYQWVITFDQDSRVTPGMISSMFDAYESYPQKEKIAGLSPRYRNRQSGQLIGSPLISSANEELPFAEARSVLTSGNMIKLNIFEDVGYFNEGLFIDYVDTEFCLRCISRGYKILEARNAILLHNIGFPIRHRLLWREVRASHHSALRRYYIARNAIYTSKEFIVKRPMWAINNMGVLLKVAILVSFYEANRKEKLTAIFMGILDGLLGRMGKCTRSIQG